MTRILTTAFCLPALAAAFLPLDADAAELTASRMERLLALFLLGMAVTFLVKRAEPARARIGTFWAFLPAAVVFLHSLVYFWSARGALYLADQDITNISSAVANTAFGRGLLPTAYVQTGDGGSFFGHHFAPALLLYVPFYWMFPSADHSIYPLLLCVTLFGGMLAWGLVLRRSLNSVVWAVFVCGLLSVPVFRLSQSFHYEALVLLFSGIALLGFYRGNAAFFLGGVLFWCLVKEDTSVYAGLLCLYLAWTGKNRKLAVYGVMVAVAAGTAGRMVQSTFAGETGPDWTSFLRPGWPQLTDRSFVEARLGAVLLMLASFGFLPLLRIRYALLVLAPTAIVHAYSFHPWHATYYGHYSYSILPLLLAGSAEAASVLDSWKWKTSAAFLLCAIAMYANASDKKTPTAPLTADRELVSARAAAARLKQFPESACVHAQSHLGPLVPVHRVVLPLFPAPGNPHKDGHGLDACSRRLYLFDSRGARGAAENSDQIRAMQKGTQDQAGYFSESFEDIILVVPVENRGSQ